MTLAPRSLFLILAVAATVLVTGCSADRHTFYSYSYRPTTVEVIDLQTKQSLWTMNIPVGQKLLLNFNAKGEDPNFRYLDVPAERMTWKLYPINRKPMWVNYESGWTYEEGSFDLPAGHRTSMRVSYRDPGQTPVAPEVPQADEIPVADDPPQVDLEAEEVEEATESAALAQ